MNFYIKIIGAVLLLLAALLAGRAYASYAERTLSEYEAFLCVLGHIKEKISCFLTTPAELLADFESDALEHSGFLPLIREGSSISEAFSECEARLAISKDAKAVLSSFLSRLGMGYKDEEIQKITAAERELSVILAREREEIPKNVKITKTLLVAASLGIIILMI